MLPDLQLQIENRTSNSKVIRLCKMHVDADLCVPPSDKVAQETGPGFRATTVASHRPFITMTLNLQD